MQQSDILTLLAANVFIFSKQSRFISVLIKLTTV